MTPQRKELFRAATAKDKLSLFQFLFDTQMLDVNVSLALLKAIHRELGASKGYDSSLYKRYAESIEGLRFYMSDVLQEIIEKWRQTQTG